MRTVTVRNASVEACTPARGTHGHVADADEEHVPERDTQRRPGDERGRVEPKKARDAGRDSDPNIVRAWMDDAAGGVARAPRSNTSVLEAVHVPLRTDDLSPTTRHRQDG
jgi:hypothetical protein